MRIALCQPDIPQNAGTILRLGACFGVGVDLIGPMGFVVTDKRLRRAGMDYLDLADMRQFPSFDAYLAQVEGRMVLLTTKAEATAHEFLFQADDVLVLGSESSGAPTRGACCSGCCDSFADAPGRSLAECRLGSGHDTGGGASANWRLAA